MSKPKPNFLAAALNKTARGPETILTERCAASSPRSQRAAARKQTTTPPSRQGRVMVSGWLPIEARSSFKLIQAKYPEKLMQDLVAEAMNDLFEKYNVPQTANSPILVESGDE